MGDWKYMIDNELTFYGAYCEFYDEISRKWHASSTRTQNDQAYTNKIIPNMPGHNVTPISAYQREDYDSVIDRIVQKGQGRDSEPYQAYAESTIKTYRRLIYYVVEAAAAHRKCENVLWESYYNPQVATTVEKQIAENGLLSKSLTIQQEKAIAKILLNNPMQSGQNMGLLLMYTLGLRNAEACAVNYDDIKPMLMHLDCTVAWIYKTTGYDSNTLKLGGKSKNADRIIPMPSLLIKLIHERRTQIEAKLGFSIGAFPIACVDDCWEKRCSARQLTTAARILFQSIQIPAAQIASIDEDLRVTSETALPFDEREPTAYIFRRNFATHMHIAGLSEAEIQYVLGHDVEEPQEARNEFVDASKLYDIKVKMDRRPLVNDSQPDSICQNIPVGSIADIHASTSFCVPGDAGKIKLHLSSTESFDSIDIHIRTQPARLHVSQTSDMCKTDSKKAGRTIDILKQYRKKYIEKS